MRACRWARELLARVALVEMDRRILTVAARLDPPTPAEDAHLDVVVPA